MRKKVTDVCKQSLGGSPHFKGSEAANRTCKKSHQDRENAAVAIINIYFKFPKQHLSFNKNCPKKMHINLVREIKLVPVY